LSISINNPDKFTGKPRAVLFDLDNTLYAYQPAHEAGMAAVQKKAARSVGAGQTEFDEAFSRARAETKTQLAGAASSHSRLLYFQRTLEHLGLRSQALLSLEFEQAYWGGFLSAVELRDGVLNFLDLLTRASIPKVIVTDLTTAIQLRKLIYLELDRRFEYVVTSEESGADKPDRSGFDLAMTKLSMLDESAASQNGEQAVWMIGDNMATDIEGAKKAINATTLALKSEIGNQGGHDDLDMAFDTFNDLERFFVEAGWDTSAR
jgi:HAD superfamily hydrolase (TIGR01549 family)